MRPETSGLYPSRQGFWQAIRYVRLHAPSILAVVAMVMALMLVSDFVIRLVADRVN